VESIRLLEEIQTLYAERQDLKNALFCAQELEDRYLRVYDKNHPQMVWIYYHLCTLHYANGEFKDALNYAQLRLALISKVICELPSTLRRQTQPKLRKRRNL
jgi:prolyl oligopeptidase PreP (S9A serine peptidase family)